MKLTARVVNLYSPTGREEDYVYDEGGFNRELQILNDEGVVVWKSGSNHPESNINTSFNGFHFLCLGHRREVFVKLEEGITFNR